MASQYSKKLLIAAGIGILLLGILIYGVVALHWFESGASKTAAVTTEVGKVIDLPKNETPTLATVTDLSKLKNKPFFAKAQIGDKVLLYIGAKVAILYRPSTHAVIEIAPLSATTP